MALKRKISIRKVLQVFLTLVVTTGCIMAMVSASRISDKQFVKSVAVHFRSDRKLHFIQEQEIMDLAINKRNIDIQHTPVSRLDVDSMEQLIMANPWVAHAQVYVDNEMVLHMYVTQRIPVARVFQQNGSSYYLDTTLSIMPLSASNVYYTTVFTNVQELREDSTSRKIKRDIVALSRRIQHDTFWTSQISQVIMDSAGMFEFVPILGDQQILFGDLTNMEEKFSNLFLFYRNVLNRIGWDKYKVLDVRFSNQVVATPALPAYGPKDLKVKDMNWINSIIETEAKNDAKDSIVGDDAIVAAAPAKPEPKPHEAPAKPAAAPAKPKPAPAKAVPAKPAAHQPPQKQHVVAAAPPKKPAPHDAKNDKRTPKYTYPANNNHH